MEKYQTQTKKNTDRRDGRMRLKGVRYRLRSRASRILPGAQRSRPGVQHFSRRCTSRIPPPLFWCASSTTPSNLPIVFLGQNLPKHKSIRPPETQSFVVIAPFASVAIAIYLFFALSLVLHPVPRRNALRHRLCVPRSSRVSF